MRPLVLLLLGGLLALTPDRLDRWCPSGAWLFPVGDRYDCQRPEHASDRTFRVNRNVGADGGGHQGADLSCGEGGEPVRAAATGLVVSAARDGWQSGYGRHVVLAHRAANGSLVYSVYAHLAPGSILVRPGQLVHAGQRLGRIGMSGRATAPHLHFEVRRASDPEVRWEKAEVIDPIAYVTGHLPTQRADTTWARPYLEWAEDHGVIQPNAAGDAPVRSGDAWRMIAASTRSPLDPAITDPDSIARGLEREGLLHGSGTGPANRPLAWSDLAVQLTRAKARGLRLGPSPVAQHSRRADAAQALGTDTIGPLRRLGRRAGSPPTLAQVCYLLAELAGDSPKTPEPTIAQAGTAQP